MSGALRILRAGVGATIQDGGRFHYRRYGVTPAGPMDWAAFRTANLALGNKPDAAAIEIGPAGIELALEADAPVAVAFCGGNFSWFYHGRALPTAARLVWNPRHLLSARPNGGVFSYLAVGGGLATPVELGSRATQTRAAIGGIGGRPLRDGDILPVANGVRPLNDAQVIAPWLARDTKAFRVVLGPQDDYFSASTLDEFFRVEFRIVAGDRMAYRLTGPDIVHARGFNIASDGMALGAIQIAGDKKPLVLMADHPPTGGYPKLGHIIRADIGRFAQLPPGKTCRFTPVGVEAARAALLALEAEIAATTAHIDPLPAWS